MSRINLKLLFFCLLLLHAAIGFSQIEMTLDSLSKRTMSLFEMGQDGNLSPYQRDSINEIIACVEREIFRYREKKDSVLQLVGAIYEKVDQLANQIKKDSTLSQEQRDSMAWLLVYTKEKADFSYQNVKIFLDQKDSFLLLSNAFDANQTLQTEVIHALILIADNADVYPNSRLPVIDKLAASRHPMALTFLMENIMNIGYPDPDPPSYGRTAIYDDYYVQYDAYPCVNALRQQAGWHLLPYFETAIEKKVIPEAYIILYAFLLNDITKNCSACRDAFLTGYKEYPERTHAMRIRTINANQIMEFYKNPKKN